MWVIFLVLEEEEGMKVRIMSKIIILIGINSSINGGGGNGGRINGSINSDVVRLISIIRDFKLK